MAVQCQSSGLSQHVVSSKWIVEKQPVGGRGLRIPAAPVKRTLRGALFATKQEEAEQDMMDVGLDDVFRMISEAEELDPGVPVWDTSKPTAFSTFYRQYWKSTPAEVDARSAYYGPQRVLWPGPLAPHLKGEHAGDFGVDPLGLSASPETFARMRLAELLHGRWAMLAVVGCLVPELIGDAGPGFEPVWWKAGAQIFEDAGIDYLGRPGLIDAHSLVAVAITHVVLMSLAEVGRARAETVGLDPAYPGQAFDPLGLSKEAESFAELKVKEVKNGRLAMIAMAGLAAQAAVTQRGPIENIMAIFHR